MTEYKQLVNKIKERYPDVKIKYKDDYWYWRKLPEKLRTSGMANYNTIWMPTRSNNFIMLAHEYQHIVDMHNMGRLYFYLMYSTPQILSLFWFLMTIIAFLFGNYIFGIIHLVVACLLLLPWPSKERVHLEMQGYKMSLYVAKLKHYNSTHYNKFIVDALRSWLYYKMIWSDDKAHKIVFEASEQINNGESVVNNDIAFRDVYEIIKGKTIL